MGQQKNGDGGSSAITRSRAPGWQTESMSDFRKLKVWQKAHAMALHAHCTASRIRGQVHVSLRSQIVRSAMSVPANIVEGRSQKGDAAFARYLRISIGSASELEYHLLTARDIGAISKIERLSLYAEVAEVRMMLHGLVRNLERTTKVGAVPTQALLSREP